jgi:hypothetical protein
MDPHPDRSDYYSDTHLWDGLAATVSRSSGARQGEGEDGSNDGANAVLGRATKPGGARGKAPVDYMAAIAAPEAERAHHIVRRRSEQSFQHRDLVRRQSVQPYWARNQTLPREFCPERVNGS